MCTMSQKGPDSHLQYNLQLISFICDPQGLLGMQRMLKQCYKKTGTTINPSGLVSPVLLLPSALLSYGSLDQDNCSPSEHTDRTVYVVQGPQPTCTQQPGSWVPTCCARPASLPDPGPSSIPPSHILALSPHSGLC